MSRSRGNTALTIESLEAIQKTAVVILPAHWAPRPEANNDAESELAQANQRVGKHQAAIRPDKALSATQDKPAKTGPLVLRPEKTPLLGPDFWRYWNSLVEEIGQNGPNGAVFL
jgi:hypothetical protein